MEDDAGTPWVAATVPGSDKVVVCSSRHRRTVARDLEPDAAELIVAAVDRLEELLERADARRTVDAAKAKLMDDEGLSEPQAHRFVQHRAMDEQVAMEVVAKRRARRRALCRYQPGHQAMIGTVVDVMLVLTRGDEVLLAERRDTGYAAIWTDGKR